MACSRYMWALACAAFAVLSAGSAGAGCGCATSRQTRSLPFYPLGLDAGAATDQCSAVAAAGATEDMVLVPAGEYQLGTDHVVLAADREGPSRRVHLKAFYIDKYEASNERFAEFVRESAYRTEAETFGDSFVFSLFLSEDTRRALHDYRVAAAPWWYKVAGADWKHPDGPHSNITDRWRHPAVHASWRDARAYCAWRGARLPSEAEWEAACRAGGAQEYPWGDQLYPQRTYMANIWQGTFPKVNSAKDGFIGTSPVELFPQNDWGLHSMAGNVWEWTEDGWADSTPDEKVKKGGSYLCHRSYCFRYRCAARSHNTLDSSAGNLGFRCARDAAP